MSEKQIVLIDVSSISHPIWHMAASDPNPNATSIGIVAKVRALASGQPHVALCLDSRKSFRKELDATYKASREPKPAPFFHQCQLAIETLKGDGFPVWEAEGFEADDLCASGVEQAKVGDWPVLIVSADKDLLALVNNRVSVKSPISGNVMTPAAVRDKFGVDPNQIPDYLAIVGDASDGVVGVRGIGAKGASALLNTFGNFDDLYRAMEKGVVGIKPAQAQSLSDFRERLPVVRQLLALRTDAPIAFADVFNERVPADVAAFGAEDEMMSDINDAMPTLGPLVPSTAEVIEHHRELTAGEAVDALGAFAADVARRVAPKDPALLASEQAGDRILHERAEAARTAAATHEAPQIVPHKDPAALVPVPVEFERQLEPRTLQEAKQLANWAFESRLFSAYGTPQAVMTTFLAGRELGLSAMASLRAFHIVENKPTLAADFIRSLVIKSGQAAYFRCTERTATRCTWATKRGDDPEVTLTYTIEEATAAGLIKDKSGWVKSPADMLVARASSKLARLVYPDVCFGLYATEEID